ncbi:NAD(P)-binding protein [Lophiostoma macrostomum CBS 122681]|uniref:NAD(P)-binding protein n=1 Tax=Lophiostoma macrostomum CBS 122681 TaxID=1314788 RepID=A0A6A6SJK6_9PLEO|nr:NAD(P)-binding protein [Lophiostoma macrostomum CBS 122681]
MARILITGSSDGLGQLAAKRLIANGHSVVLHARNASRANDTTKACPGAETVLIADLSSLSETKRMADEVNKLGAFDCIIHNAGLYRGPARMTQDGIPALAVVNTLAPYVLTSLITRPKRIVFLSSEMHQSGSSKNLDDALWVSRGEKPYSEGTAYCDSKLHNVMFAKAFARRWNDVQVNALDPGWVATKMGGSSAPDDPEASVQSYVMLAEGQEKLAKTTGRYFGPGKVLEKESPVSYDEQKQERLLDLLAAFSGVKKPE